MAANRHRRRVRYRTLKVYLGEARGRYGAEDENGDLLGISSDKNNTIGSAVREANDASKAACKVSVQMEQRDGTFKTEYITRPASLR
jgi:hypothetical protein